MTLLALETRQRDPIDNRFDSGQPLQGEVEKARELQQKFFSATHRPTAVCYTYNCHGLTFASRRTAINSPSEVRKILNQDGYKRINTINDVLAGDIVIYIGQDGDIEHSGIVLENSANVLVRNPLILSKWGVAHEVIHRLAYCPYGESRTEFYRLYR